MFPSLVRKASAGGPAAAADKATGAKPGGRVTRSVSLPNILPKLGLKQRLQRRRGGPPQRRSAGVFMAAMAQAKAGGGGLGAAVGRAAMQSLQRQLEREPANVQVRARRPRQPTHSPANRQNTNQSTHQHHSDRFRLAWRRACRCGGRVGRWRGGALHHLGATHQPSLNTAYLHRNVETQ